MNDMNRPIIKLPKTSNESFSRKRKRVQNLISKEEEVFLSRLYQLQCQVTSNVGHYDDFLKRNSQIRQQLEEQLHTIKSKVKSISFDLGLDRDGNDPYQMGKLPFQENGPIPRVARREMMHKMFVINKKLNADIILNNQDSLEDIKFSRDQITQTLPPERFHESVQTEENCEDELEELKLFQNILYLDYQIERFRAN